MLLGDHLDCDLNQIKNAILEILADDPASPTEGRFWYNVTSHKFKYRTDAKTVVLFDEFLASIGVTSPIVNTGTATAPVIGIQAASAAQPGYMTAAHYSMLAGATNSSTGDALVKRDASGNFSAGTITANLTGTASNASQFNGQAASYYLNRANHTGTQTASTISDLATVVKAYRLSEFAVPNADLSMGNYKLTNLADPTNPQDAVTLNFLTMKLQGLDPKASVRLATTANITLSGLQTIDGKSALEGDRVLVKDQTTTAQNGIYLASASSWTRAADADAWDEIVGAFTPVEEGTANGDTIWMCVADKGGTLGTTAITWTQVNGAGSTTTSYPLVKSGNNIALQRSTNTLILNGSNQLAVGGGTANLPLISKGNSSEAVFEALNLGASGAVQGVLPVTFGGTGGNSAEAARTALGFAKTTTSTIGDGTTKVFTITHGLGATPASVIVRRISDNKIVTPTISANATQVVVTFGVAPATNAFEVLMVR